jgi:hypothetical protein
MILAGIVCSARNPALDSSSKSSSPLAGRADIAVPQ